MGIWKMEKEFSPSPNFTWSETQFMSDEKKSLFVLSLSLSLSHTHSHAHIQILSPSLFISKYIVGSLSDLSLRAPSLRLPFQMKRLRPVSVDSGMRFTNCFILNNKWLIFIKRVYRSESKISTSLYLSEKYWEHGQSLWIPINTLCLYLIPLDN